MNDMSTLAKRYEIAKFVVATLPGAILYLVVAFVVCIDMLGMERPYAFACGQAANSILNFFIQKEWVFAEYGHRYTGRLVILYTLVCLLYHLTAFVLMSAAHYMFASNAVILAVTTPIKTYISFRFIKPLFSKLKKKN